MLKTKPLNDLLSQKYLPHPAPFSQPEPRRPRPRQRSPEHMLRLLPIFGVFIREWPPLARLKLRFPRFRQPTLPRRHPPLKRLPKAHLKRSNRLLLSSRITIFIFKSLLKGLLVAVVGAVCIVKGRASLLKTVAGEAVGVVVWSCWVVSWVS
ncbi:hypothetical protein HOY80DRAFT_1006771 [Tuber brumale]|nr:hypothetical protein HOY80DRAFT_1006771 [Tuber brumale]